MLGFLALVFALVADTLRVYAALLESKDLAEAERGRFQIIVRALVGFAVFWLFIATVASAAVKPSIESYEPMMNACLLRIDALIPLVQYQCYDIRHSGVLVEERVHLCGNGLPAVDRGAALL